MLIRTDNANLNGLLPLLQRLDRLLETAIAAAQIAYGTAPDPHRGLHIDEAEVDRLLTREPASPAFQGYAEPDEPIPAIAIQPDSRLEWLQHTFDLAEFDLDVLAIALAPELDRRYERLYAYLQDDVRCKRPSVDLAFNLLCSTAIEKLNQRVHFAPDAPLIRHRLLHLVPEPNQTQATLLMQELHLDQQVVRFLLDQPGLDRRLIGFCQLTQPPVTLDVLRSSEDFQPNFQQSLAAFVQQHWQSEQPLRLYFEGDDHPGKRQTAAALAHSLNIPLLAADLPQMIHANVDMATTLPRLFREAWFQHALLYLDGIDRLQTPEQAIAHQHLLTALTTSKGITILTGQQPWIPTASEPLGLLTLTFPMPDFNQRRRYWQQSLATADLKLEESDLDAIADRFRLTSTQIADAVITAVQHAQLEARPCTAADLFTTARSQSGHQLGTLARKIEPNYTWNDIVLPVNPLTQLQELCNQSKYRHIVYGDWGFGRKLSLGKGLNVLFCGLPGTGKTMAAEVIANELQLDLYKIDLSQIVSKYIGETEKNLDRIFTAAANSNAILLFDEADALFGKRSEVQDAHDRYANIEIGYLLQKMEEYEGIAILTTNLRSSLDDAFVRRLRFMIEFPLPDERDRYQIWQQVWTDAAPLAPDVNLEVLAQQLEITGAEIRNIALAAAFLAASQGQAIGMAHLMQAVRREYRKMGKLLMAD